MHAELVSRTRDSQRGQAVVETVVFLPMFLIALFGIIWSVQAAVQYERVESAVRYAGLISQGADPYLDYSMYSLYTQLGSTTIPTITCVTPLTDALSDAAPTYTSSTSGIVTASSPFWSPASAPNPNCGVPGLVGTAAAGNGLSQDVILSQQTPSVTSNIAAPAALKALASITSAEADERFFKPVGENVILACYPALNTQLTASLHESTDSSLATLPVALPNSVPAIPLAANPACTTGM